MKKLQELLDPLNTFANVVIVVCWPINTIHLKQMRVFFTQYIAGVRLDWPAPLVKEEMIGLGDVHK